MIEFVVVFFMNHCGESFRFHDYEYFGTQMHKCLIGYQKHTHNSKMEVNWDIDVGYLVDGIIYRT